MQELNRRLSEFNSDIEKIPMVKELSDMTGLPPSFFGTLLLTGGVFLVACNFPYTSVLVQSIGTVYPCIKSIQALQTKDTDADDK